MLHVVVLAVRILSVAVMLPSPSYILATIREFDNPREMFSNEGSKDARVATYRQLVILIRERAAQ